MVYLNQAYHGLLVKCERDKTPLSQQVLQTAILEGASMRVRPVVMTSVSIIVGLLPVLYGTGTGSEVMSRIAAPMIGGMLSALVLSLLILPVMYLLWRQFELRHRLQPL